MGIDFMYPKSTIFNLKTDLACESSKKMAQTESQIGVLS